MNVRRHNDVKRSAFSQSISLLTFFTFLFSNTISPVQASALAGSPTAQVESALVKQFTPPVEFGRIVDASSTPSSSIPQVIHIQDLHANYSVQSNIAKLLDFLDSKLGAGNYKVAIEGAQGPLAITQLGKIEDKNFKIQICDRLMKEAELTGTEYFSIVNGKTDVLWGAEDERYHLANIALFQKTYAGKQEMVKALSGIEKELAPIKDKYYNGKLRQLDKMEVKFASGKIGMDAYLRYLTHIAAKYGVDVANQYPEIAKNTGMTQADAYTSADKLLTEKEELAVHVRQLVAKNDIQRNLTQVENELALFKRFMDEQVTTQEVRDLAPRLSEMAGHVKVLLDSVHASYDQKNLSELVSAGLDYYVIALARDKFLTDNALKLLDVPHSSVKTVVLVAGGFHTPGISKLLQEKGVSYITISPNVTERTDRERQLYIARLMDQHPDPRSFVTTSGQMLSWALGMRGGSSGDAARGVAAEAEAVGNQQALNVALPVVQKTPAPHIGGPVILNPTQLPASVTAVGGVLSIHAPKLAAFLEGADGTAAQETAGEAIQVAASGILPDAATQKNVGATRIAINGGSGRIGINVIRDWLQSPYAIELVGLNDVAFNFKVNGLKGLKNFAHLLRSEFATAPRSAVQNPVITYGGEEGDYWIAINGKKIKVTDGSDPTKLPWAALNVDVVLEATGKFTAKEAAALHLQAGAKKVIITAPATGDLPTIVTGVNENVITPDQTVYSNASCTTNALAPILKVISDEFGIEHAEVTSIHAYTNDQSTQDTLRPAAPNRGRAAAESIIPETSGAGKAIKEVIPKLAGKVNVLAYRVPVRDGSKITITMVVDKPTTKDAVNSLLKANAEGPYKGVLAYLDQEEDGTVSHDILGRSESSLVQSNLTNVDASGTHVTVRAWYDNEFAYSNRLIDLVAMIMQTPLRPETVGGVSRPVPAAVSKQLEGSFTRSNSKKSGLDKILKAKRLKQYIADTFVSTWKLFTREIPKDVVSNRVQEIINHPDFANKSERWKLNMAKLYGHGILAGSGQLVILPIDQGLEHSPLRSWLINRFAASKWYQVMLAYVTGMSAYAAPYGTIKQLAPIWARHIPLIAKVNSSIDGIGNDKKFQQSAVAGDIAELAALKVPAVGFTLYLGTSPEQWEAQLRELKIVTDEAAKHGLVVIVWSYPRGADIEDKNQETALDVSIAAVQAAVDAGADVVKIKASNNVFWDKEKEKWLESQQWFIDGHYDLDKLEDRTAIVTYFAKGRELIFSGGEADTEDKVLDQIARLILGGAGGDIVGRNLFQREFFDATKLALKIMALNLAVTERAFARNDVQGLKDYAFNVVLPRIEKQQNVPPYAPDYGPEIDPVSGEADGKRYPDAVAEMLDRQFAAERPAVNRTAHPHLLRNLERIYRSGELAGTGKLLIVPMNKNGEQVAGASAYTLPADDVAALGSNIVGLAPVIAKISATPYREGTVSDDYAHPAVLPQIKHFAQDGVAAVGYTITLDKGFSYNAQLSELQAIMKEARDNGLPLVVWVESKGERANGVDIMTTGTQAALEAGAHLVIVNQPITQFRSTSDLAAQKKNPTRLDQPGDAMRTVKWFGAFGDTRQVLVTSNIDGDVNGGLHEAILGGADGVSFNQVPAQDLFNHAALEVQNGYVQKVLTDYLEIGQGDASPELIATLSDRYLTQVRAGRRFTEEERRTFVMQELAALLTGEIEGITAKEIFDSRDTPTVMVEITLKAKVGWLKVREMVPSGASTGEFEAVEKRDNDLAYKKGKGVFNAIENVNTTIANGIEVLMAQKHLNLKTNSDFIELINAEMRRLDGTPNMDYLGANAILPVEMAATRAMAVVRGLPLYQFVHQEAERMWKVPVEMNLPIPMFNVGNGGMHVGLEPGEVLAEGEHFSDVQEYMFSPDGASTFRQAFGWVQKVFTNFVNIRRGNGRRLLHAKNVGNEKGLKMIVRSNEEPITQLEQAAVQAGLSSDLVSIRLDVAASSFYDPKTHTYKFDAENIGENTLIHIYKLWRAHHPMLRGIEDPLDEHGLAQADRVEDPSYQAWKRLTRELGGEISIVGDDLFVTNLQRLHNGIEKGIGNSILIKVNQIGSVKETLDAIWLAKQAGYEVIISHRSGETLSTFIVDLAVGTGAGRIKTGGIAYWEDAKNPSNGYERMAKYDREKVIEMQDPNIPYARTLKPSANMWWRSGVAVVIGLAAAALIPGGHIPGLAFAAFHGAGFVQGLVRTRGNPFIPVAVHTNAKAAPFFVQPEEIGHNAVRSLLGIPKDHQFETKGQRALDEVVSMGPLAPFFFVVGLPIMIARAIANLFRAPDAKVDNNLVTAIESLGRGVKTVINIPTTLTDWATQILRERGVPQDKIAAMTKLELLAAA